MARRFTLVVVPHHHSHARTVGGPFVLACGILLAFIIALVVWSVGTTYVAALFDTGSLAALERDNALLVSRLHELEQRSETFAQRMNSTVQHDKELRIIAVMPDLPEAIRQVGVGGPLYAASDMVSSGSTLATATALEEKLHRLLREARLETASFQAITSKVETNQKVWRRVPTVRPVEGYLSSRFGVRNDPFTGRRRTHKGVDMGARSGARVQAPAEGMVIMTGWNRSYGRYVDIDHRNGFTTRYGHLSKILVQRGDHVRRRDPIGIVGETGRATGEHLHYEVRLHGRPVDPTFYFYPEETVVD